MPAPAPLVPLPIAVGAVLLAAGASARMGQPKMLLPWGSTSVIGHLIAQWESLGAEQIAVVCAANDLSISAELDRVHFPREDRILNPQPSLGMFSSIHCAAQWSRWKATLSHAAIVLGDQPHLRLDTLRAIFEFAAQHRRKICQPSWNGRRRHPVLLPWRIFRDLTDATTPHLKDFLQLQAEQIAVCEINDPGLDLDLDRPSDYEQAKGSHLNI